MAHFRMVVKALANAIDDASRCSMAHFHMVVKDVRSIVLGCSTPE